MDFLDCKICNNPYDEKDYRPRSAPCGHELCTSCIKGLIKDSTLMCPKCRKVSKVEVSDDLPITFGLIDVIRALKTMNISSTKEGESIQSAAMNDEMCSIHCKAIGHWCFKCRKMICEKCLENHPFLIGCSTENIKCMKEKHIENANKLLTIYEKDINYVSTLIQEHTKLAEKHWEKAKQLSSVLEQGNTHKKELMDSKTHLNLENSSHGVIDRIEELTRREQSLKSWSVSNLGIDTPNGLLKILAEKKDVFTEMDNEFGQRHAKISQHNESIYFHTFENQEIAEDSICIDFDRIQKLIPPSPSLVFLELSMDGIVKGCVFIRLKINLPNIRENMVTIVTGQKGKSFKGLSFNNKLGGDINIDSILAFKDIPVTADVTEAPTAVFGNVIGYYGKGYLKGFYLYADTKPNTTRYETNDCVIGNIERGMDILLECYNKFEDVDVLISDCGFVIEPQ